MNQPEKIFAGIGNHIVDTWPNNAEGTVKALVMHFNEMLAAAGIRMWRITQAKKVSIFNDLDLYTNINIVVEIRWRRNEK